MLLSAASPLAVMTALTVHSALLTWQLIPDLLDSLLEPLGVDEHPLSTPGSGEQPLLAEHIEDDQRLVARDVTSACEAWCLECGASAC